MELAEIAASVAKALGLEEITTDVSHGFQLLAWKDKARFQLRLDGSNLFEPVWRAHCLDWLLENNYLIDLLPAHRSETNELLVFWKVKAAIEIADLCPASEFAARAIHHLMAASAQSDR